MQLDDTNYAYLCDPKMLERIAATGDDPKALPLRYAKVINASIADRPTIYTSYWESSPFWDGWEARTERVTSRCSRSCSATSRSTTTTQLLPTAACRRCG